MSRALLSSASILTSMQIATSAIAQTESEAASAAASTGSVSVDPKTTISAVSESPNLGNALGEIVVTAQKRAQNLQRVPIAVTAVSGAALQSRGITNIKELTQTVPGFSVQTVNGLVLPFLRGVGNSGSTAGNEASVASYVDGVYFSRLSSSFFDLNSVDRVEVLKGPQGTLFGRNSTGGVVNIVTLDPAFTSKLFGTLSYGRYNSVQGSAYGTAPLSDTVAVDLSASAKTSDGFGRNLVDNHRYGYEDSVLVRSKLLIRPSDRTQITVSGFYNWSRQSVQKFAFPGTSVRAVSAPFPFLTSQNVGFYDESTNIDQYSDFRLWGVSARIEQDLSFAKLVSISAYTDERENTLVGGPDYKLSYGGAHLTGPVRQFTQEVQLASKTSSKIDWLLGFYYYNNYTAYDGSPTLFGPAYGPGIIATAHQKVASYAGFAQVTYEILPRLKITGGVRYTADDTSAAGILELATSPTLPLQNVPPGSKTTNNVTLRAIADYQVSDSVLGYVSFNRGYKAGNFNLLTYNSDQPTKPEKLDAYEVGLKTELFDRRLRVNGALFYYDISNPQVQTEGQGTVIFSNAGASRVRGAELDIQALIVQGLTTRASFAYLDSHYTDYPNAPASMPDPNGGAILLPAINAAGHRTPLAPKVTIDLGVDYALETSQGKVTLTVDYYHNSGYFFEPDNLLHQGSYDLVNAQIGHSLTKNIELRLWAKNLNGAKYVAFASTIVGPLGYQWQPAAPRTFGGAVDFRF